MAKLKSVLGWIGVGSGVGLVFIGVRLLAVMLVVTYIIFAFTGKVPTPLDWWEAFVSPPKDPWAYQTPETPVLFTVTGPPGAIVDVTLGVKNGETLHLPHQRTPYDTTLKVKHGRDVFLRARNESPQRAYINVEIKDGMDRMYGGTCNDGLCLAEASAKVR